MTKLQSHTGILNEPGIASIVVAEAIERCSPQAAEILGRPVPEVIGKRLLDFSPERQPDGQPSAAQLAQRLTAARRGLAQSFEWRFLRPDGTPVDTLLTLSGDGEEQTRLVGKLRDVTALAGAETALRETENRLQQILDNTTAVVYAKDRDGRYLMVNRHFERLFHLQEKDLLGKTDYDVFPAAIADTFRANDQRVLEELAPAEFEEQARLPGGEHTYLSLKFPLFTTDGEPYGVCGISTDITARKRMENALRNVALGVSAARGEEVFPAIVSYLANSLGVALAFVGKLVDGASKHIETLAISHNGKIVENVEYDLAHTPCETVVGDRFRFIPQGVQTLYPGDNMLAHLGVESYAGYPLFGSGGQHLGLIAVMDTGRLQDRDTTEAMLKIFSVRAAAELERLNADEERRASEQSYRTIFDASEDAIFVHDLDTGAIIDVNPKACLAYGYSRGELLKLHPGDLGSGVPPYTRDEALELIRRAAAGEAVRTEWHRRNKDGSLHWDEVRLKRATIAGVDRLLVFTREITERKEREMALAKSESRLRATVEAALDCIIGMDTQGQIVEFNPAAERCFGYRREDVLGQPLAELIIPERDRRAHHEGMKRYLTGGKGPFFGRRVEVKALRRDGGEFPAELAISVAQGPDGDIFIGYLRDITERVRAEDERNLLEAQLRQAQKMEAIGHLSGGVAHDFNNILTGVMGYIVLSQERAEGYADEKLDHYLDRAQQSGQRARDLIRQMLTFSRGQRGEPRPLALGPVLAESVKLLGSTLPSTIELSVNVDENVPAVMLDPVQVEQVVMNLCINARDAMTGSGRIDIHLRGARCKGAVCTSCRQAFEGQYVELSVRDTGPGIPPEHLDRIFEPFFTTKEPGKGSGMGLSTVHGIVHEYGAHILVEPAPGGGTVFRVLFPALQPGVAGAAPQTGAAAHSHHEELHGRVLVVDDDEVAGGFMEDLFASWGLDVTLARNGAEGYETFSAAPDRFDLVLLDQTMPRMTGLEAATKMRALRADVPLVLYTGYSDDLTSAQVEAAGLQALLRKPVDTPELLKLVTRLLSASAGNN